jgi:hypothetical protein
MVDVLVVCADADAAAALLLPPPLNKLATSSDPAAINSSFIFLPSSRTAVTTFVSIVPIVRCIPPILLSII